MMDNTPYKQFSSLLLFRSFLAVILIGFVLAKPIYALSITVSEDNTEISALDAENENSEEEDSQEEKSESDTEEEELEEDKMQDNSSLAFVHSKPLNNSAKLGEIQKHHLSDFYHAIILPPPEFL